MQGSPLSAGARIRRHALVFLAALLAAACSDGQQPSGAPVNPPVEAIDAVPEGSGFDFYVLSLSWSPSYCEAEGANANRQQCGAGRPFRFVVHGLWPQFEKGWPESCPTERPLDVPDRLLRELQGIMPSTGLIRHQWRKHGTCSGLSQQDYFDVLRRAREKVTIPSAYATGSTSRTVDPETVERDFLDANAGLPAEGIAVTCDERLLREVRICMTGQLDFRACPEVDRRACRRRSVEMPPTRGR